MTQARMIPKEQWDKHKEHICDFYFTNKGTISGLVSYMSENHGFVASKDQFYRKVRGWGKKKYSSKSEWEHVKKVIDERKNDGKETEIIMRGQLVPVKKLKKEVGRHVYHRYGPPVASSKKPRGFTPSEIKALTPSSSADILLRGYTIPWTQFQDFMHWLVFQPATQSANLTYTARLQNWQFDSRDLVKLVNYIVGPLPAATDQYETFAQAMSLVQDQVPNRYSLGTITQCHATASSPLVQVFGWLIYRLTNNILVPHNAYDELSSFFKNNLASRLSRTTCSEGGSTVQILLSKLLLGAVQKEDVSFVKILLKLGARPNIKQIGKSNTWETPLGTAAELQNSEIVKLLLRQGADPNSYSHSSNSSIPASCGRSPLMLALSRPGGYDVVKQLVDHGAIVNTLAQQPCTRPTPLILASANKDIKAAEFLIEKGSEINFISCHCPSALQRAVAGNDLKMVRLLLRNRADPNIRPSSENVQSHWPCFRDHDVLLPLTAVARHRSDIEIAKCLLEHGAEIDGFIPSDVTDANHYTALQASIEIRDFAMTEFFLHQGANPDARDATIPTALQQACELFRYYSHYSCRRKIIRRKIIDLLLKSSADVNADPFHSISGNGETALQIATRSGDRDLITSLVYSGGNINSSPSCLQTAIDMQDISLVEFLLENGADANFQFHQFGGIWTPLQTALSSGNIEIVKLLLNSHADLNARPSPSGMNPLEIIAFSGSVELVNLLMELDVTIDQESFTAALERAVQNGHTSVVRLLLKKRANIDIKAMAPKLLYMAIEAKCKELFNLFFAWSTDASISVELLGLLVAAVDHRWPYAADCLIGPIFDAQKLHHAEAFGNQDRLNEYYELLLYKAIESHQVTLVEKLVHAGGAIQTRGLGYLKIAIESRDPDMVRVLLERGVSPNHVFAGTSLTPLHLSLMSGELTTYSPNGWQDDFNIVRTLIEYKANVNAYSFEEGYPLQMIWRGNWDFRRESEVQSKLRALLLEAGADTAHLPSDLQFAAQKGDIERVRLLIANGEDVNRPAVEYRGATALQYAAMHGHFNIVALLLKNGANIHAPGAEIDGRTALQGAAENGRIDIVHLLLENDDETELLEERCCDAAKYAAREGHTVIAETLWAWSCMKTVSTMPHEGCGT